MMPRSRANEIPQLVRQLGSRSAARVEAARARLSIIGAPAVESLIDALEGSNPRLRSRAMSLLALIADPRGRDPLIAVLEEPDPDLRRVAAQCLARFLTRPASTALERCLHRDAEEAVRVAAVNALVRHAAAGCTAAIRAPLDRLLDPAESVAVRLAAAELVRVLPAAEARRLLARLREDPSPQLRQRAAELETDLQRAAEPATQEIAALLRQLASEDYATWNEAVRRLAGADAAAVDSIVREICRCGHDPEFCTRAGMALKTVAPRHAGPLADALERIEDPLPLQVLVEVIGAIGDKSLIYRLKDLVERLAVRRVARGEGRIDLLRRVRAKAHLELARIGSRVAVGDLREALGRGGSGLELEMLAAVELIGKREELPLLLRAHRHEDAFVRRHIADAFRAIMARERIRRDDRIFDALTASDRQTLAEILPRPSPARRRGRTAESGSG